MSLKIFKLNRLSASEWLFFAILASSILLNIIYLSVLEDKIYWPDERWYIKNAEFIANDFKFDPKSSRGPGYPLFLGLWMTFGKSFFWLRLSGVALGVISCYLTYKISFEIYKNLLIARISAILVMTYPFFIYMRGFLISESMIITFVLLFTWCVLYVTKNPEWKNLLMAGFVSGLSILVRPVLLFSPFCIPFILLRNRKISHKKAVASFLAFGFIFSIVVGGWIIRNYIETGNIYITSRGNCEIYKGMATDPGKSISSFKTPNDPKKCKEAFVHELKNDFFRVVYRKLYYAIQFWSPKFDHVTEQNKDKVFSIITFVILPLLYLSAIYGWYKASKETRFAVVSILFIYWFFHIVVVVKFRYRIPIDSLLLIFASGAFGIITERISVRHCLRNGR